MTTSPESPRSPSRPLCATPPLGQAPSLPARCRFGSRSSSCRSHRGTPKYAMNDEVDRPLVSPDHRSRQELRVDRVKRGDRLLLAPASHEHTVDLQFRQVTTTSPTTMRIFQAKRLQTGFAPRAGRKVCELVSPSFLDGRVLRQRLRPRVDVVFLGQQLRPSHLWRSSSISSRPQTQPDRALPCPASPSRRASRHCRPCPPARRDHNDGAQKDHPGAQAVSRRLPAPPSSRSEPSQTSPRSALSLPRCPPCRTHP